MYYGNGLHRFQTSQFRPLDKVYHIAPDTNLRTGPYVVASVPKTARYTLVLEDGAVAFNGAVVEEVTLTKA